MILFFIDKEYNFQSRICPRRCRKMKSNYNSVMERKGFLLLIALTHFKTVACIMLNFVLLLSNCFRFCYESIACTMSKSLKLQTSRLRSLLQTTLYKWNFHLFSTKQRDLRLATKLIVQKRSHNSRSKTTTITRQHSLSRNSSLQATLIGRKQQETHKS